MRVAEDDDISVVTGRQFCRGWTSDFVAVMTCTRTPLIATTISSLSPGSPAGRCFRTPLYRRDQA